MKINLLLIAVIAVLLLCSRGVSGQKGYKIEIKISGNNDTVLYLGSYYGENMTVIDTCFPEKTGTILFSGEKELEHGVYFLVSQKQVKLFEFIVDQSQHFKLYTDAADYIGNIKIKGSNENELFFEYQNTSAGFYKQIRELNQLRTKINNQDSLKIIQDKIQKINNDNINFKLEFIDTHPDHLLTLVFQTLKEPDIPDSLKGNTKDQQIKAYQYYKKHYWDKTDLTDKRILRTPVFHTKLDNYFSQIISKNPDSIISEIDYLLESCKTNEKLFEYLTWYFTATYESSNVMGYDKIFVHLVDNYFRDQQYDWVSTSMYTNLIDRADKIRPLLIGNYAPELIMIDTNNRFISIFEIENDYILIFFWTTTCGECKEEARKLREIYSSHEFDLEIYAVNTDTSLAKWKKHLRRNETPWINVNGTRSLSRDYHILFDVNKTPTIYILDEKRKIIAKHLDAAHIPGFISRQEKIKNKNNK